MEPILLMLIIAAGVWAEFRFNRGWINGYHNGQIAASAFGAQQMLIYLQQRKIIVVHNDGSITPYKELV